MERNQSFNRKYCIALGILCLSLPLAPGAWANSTATLQGQSAGSTTWVGSNLRGWRDMDYVPTRVYLSGGPQTAFPISIGFDHGQLGLPYIEDLTRWTNSANVVITSGPTLRYTSAFGFWYYDLTVNVTDNNPGYIEFRTRLAAGAHLNPGSSLHLVGDSSLGVLQVFKAAIGHALPDLGVRKAGPSRAEVGSTITYTLSYTNKANASDPATTVQMSDILPDAVTYVPGSASNGGRLVGNMLYWDLGTLPQGASGSVTYQAVVKSTVADGTTFSNLVQIFSGEDDDNYSDNSASVETTAYADALPVANDDSYTVNEDAVLSVPAPGVMQNDTLPGTNAFTAVQLRNTSHGGVTFNSNGSFVYTPELNYNGTDSFTYQVRGRTNSAPATVTIAVLPVNDPPVAQADSYSINMDTPLIVPATNGVLANDSDVDSADLAAVLVDGPAHGTVGLDSDGSFTYTPNANFFGSDSFTYKASDGVLFSAVVPVTIIVNRVNHAPIATPDTYSVSMETRLEVPANGVLANDIDRDTNNLSATLVSDVAHGRLNLSSDGSFTYVPVSNFFGTDTFTYKASDGALFSEIVPVTITVNHINHAPMATPDTYSVNMETRLEISANGVLANDTDRDTNTLTATLVSDVTHGTLSLSADGSFTYVPVSNFFGTDTFTYKASDGALFSEVVPVTITVNHINHAPIASPDTYSVNMETRLEVPANGVLSNDTDRDTNTLTATLVSDVTHGTLSLSADGSFTYVPVSNFFGTDNFTYKASDGGLFSEIVPVTITVNHVNHAPIANQDTYSVNMETQLEVLASGVLSNDTDRDTNSLTATLASNVTHGTLSLSADGSFTYVPVSNYFGTDNFTYKASDGALFSGIVPVTISVNHVNHAPIANQDTYSVNMETRLEIPANGVLANDIDRDTNTLTAILVSDVTHGTLSLSADGSFTYVPVGNFFGSDSFTYKASDGALFSAVVPVTITVNHVNHAPIANVDSYSVNMETQLEVPASGVLANDTDRDTNNLSATLVSDVAHGTLSLSSDGSFAYVPVSNFFGTDTFTYKASDGALFSAVVPVTITINHVNHTPIASPDTYSVNMETRLEVPASGVLANDTDRDTNTLTATLVSDVTHGTLSLNSDGSFTYVPASNFFGTDGFTYKANDGALFSAVVPVTITVNPVNHAPIGNPDSYVVNMESSLAVNATRGVLANDTDRDNNALTAVLVSNPSSFGLLPASGNSRGSFQLKADGSFTYTPATGFYGTDSFTYKANDGSTNSATVTVSITVNFVNHAPSFTKGLDQLINENSEPQTVSAWATAISPGPSYESHQTVTFFTSTDREDLFSAPPAISPDGTLTYTPKANVIGHAQVTTFVRDNGGTENGGVDTSASQTFSIEINGPPTVRILEPTNNSTFIAPAQFAVLAEAADPDGTLSHVELYQGTNLVASLTNAPFYQVLTNVAAGQYDFTAVSVDYMGLKATSAPVHITVLASAPIQPGSITLNAQTGRFEQWVKVLNPTPIAYSTPRVYVWGLPSTDAVHNPSGFMNGKVYMQTNTTIPAGGSAWMLIQYYVPSRQPTTPSLWGQLLGPVSGPALTEEQQRITHLAKSDTGAFELEFATATNRYYCVRYSEDFKTWKAVQPNVLGTGSLIKWVDTQADCGKPACSGSRGRYYRVTLLP